MITDKDLMFSSIPVKSIRYANPQWSVSIGGREVAQVVERPITHPRYRVSISGVEDKLFARREEVIKYIIAALTSDVV